MQSFIQLACFIEGLI